jgi:hypothetical protein
MGGLEDPHADDSNNPMGETFYSKSAIRVSVAICGVKQALAQLILHQIRTGAFRKHAGMGRALCQLQKLVTPSKTWQTGVAFSH